MGTTFLVLFIILFALFSMGWFYSFQVKVFSWIDFLWSSSFLIVLTFLLFFENYQTTPELFLFSMYAIWSVRLSFHLFIRIKKHGEDKRYIKLIKRWKVWYGLFFYLLFIAQAVLVLILTIPLHLDLKESMGPLQWTGIIFFFLSVVGESLSDYQLKKFVKTNKGRSSVCKNGLWRYSRHPNYFFETMIWLSFAIFVMDAKFGLLGLIPFLVMLFLITKVTGIPPAEDSSLQSKKDEYLKYQRETSKFIPWIPKLVTIIFVTIIMIGGLPVSFAQMNMSNDQIVRIENVFNGLRADKLEILNGFYDEKVVFVDPLGEHAGLDSVRAYYKNLYQNVESIRFDFKDSISQDNHHVVMWQMILKTPSLNGGKEVILNGNSVIKFNSQNLVEYHRDYFDMGEFIYEKIPVLGWVISVIKNKMRAH